MTTALNLTLRSLKDLDGVEGSFLLDPEGVVLAQDMPAYFGDAAGDVGPRVVRLCETLSATEGGVERCIVRFPTHTLSLRPIGINLLTVIAREGVNMPALRMASNLVARKLVGAALDTAHDELSASTLETRRETPSTEPPPTLREPVVQRRRMGAPEATRPKPATSRAMYYRGKRIDS